MLNRLFKKNDVHLQRNKFVEGRKVSACTLLGLAFFKVASPIFLCCVASSKLPQLIQYFCERDGIYVMHLKNVVVIVEFLFDVAVALSKYSFAIFKYLSICGFYTRHVLLLLTSS